MRKNRYKAIPAVFLILKKGNKILLQRRYNTGYEDGNYTSISGHVDENETPIEAIIREAKEEAGIDILPKDLVFVHIQYRKGTDRARTDFYFIAKKWKGTPRIAEPEKSDDLSWFDMNNLPKNTIPFVINILEHLKNNDLYSEFGWKTKQF